MPRCLVVQHVEPEGPYALGDALTAAGTTVDLRRVHTGDDLPDTVEGLDGLVVMGGPASAISDDGFPSRRAELTLVRDALDREVPVLGVCLGAQLLALAAGGEVYAGGSGPEIGWGPVDLTAEAADDPLLAGLPSPLTVLHWHGDTFSLPAGSVHLAASAAYPNQAFRAGTRAWGLQFHVEVDSTAVERFVASFGGEAAAAGADPGEIRARADACLAGLAEARDRVAGRFAALVAGVHPGPALVEQR